MEQAYFNTSLKEMTMPDLPDAIAEAHAGEPVDICENLQPQVIDNATGAVCEFIEGVKQVKK